VVGALHLRCGGADFETLGTEEAVEEGESHKYE
jgi:hypothetical protein